MELVGGCTDLNLMHGFADTEEKDLRNTMLYQEELFRKQVVELHHIYRAQRDLMKNICFKEPAETKQYTPCGTEQSSADVKLALIIHWDGLQNGGGKSDYREESPGMGSMGDARDTSTLTSLAVPDCSRDNQGSPDSVLSMTSIANSSIMHAPYGSTATLPDQRLCRGLEHCHDDLHLNDRKKNTTRSVYEREELDLNKYPCDESFSQYNDLAMADLSRFNLTGPSHRLVGEFHFGSSPCSNNGKEHGANFSQTSNWAQQDADSTYMESEGKSNGQSDRISIVYHTDIESVSGISPGNHIKSDCHSRNHNFMDMPMPLNETHRDVVIQESRSLNVKDVELSNVSYQGNMDEDIGSIRCISCKKNYSVEKFSTKTVQAGTHLDLMKVSSSGMLPYNDSCALEQDSEPSSVNDVKAQQCHKTNEEPPEFDKSVQRGAVSLVYFLLNGCSKDQDAVEETNRTENLKERPQYPSDSFESIVLKLPESNVDDYCVTSKTYEVDDTSTRDCGIKLRRGTRRIKDFRKDVLPHLPSLSSGEIWEDMKIMQDALKSREYKRMRSMEQNEQSGSSPLKSRRTRSNRVARRRNA